MRANDKRTTVDRLSPYHVFSRSEWAKLRKDTPMTLTLDDVSRVRSMHVHLDMAEVEEVYLPLSRLLSQACGKRRKGSRGSAELGIIEPAYSAHKAAHVQR